MLRNKIAPAVLVVILFATTVSSALPVYAQDSNGNSGGFFSGFGRFISRFFNKSAQTDINTQNGDPSGEMPKIMPMPSGSFKPMPPKPFDMKEGTGSGQTNPMMMEDGRLLGLVKAGKITEAQRQAILAELKKQREELLAWAKSQGIDPMYVLPGPPMGLGGIPGENKMMNGTPSSMMKPPPQGGRVQNGGPDGARGQGYRMPPQESQ